MYQDLMGRNAFGVVLRLMILSVSVDVDALVKARKAVVEDEKYDQRMSEILRRKGNRRNGRLVTKHLPSVCIS